MTLKDFVASIGEGNWYAIQSSHKFYGRTGSVFTDNGYAGFTFAKREGFGSDWGLGKVRVRSITVYTSRDRGMPCAVLDD